MKVQVAVAAALILVLTGCGGKDTSASKNSGEISEAASSETASSETAAPASPSTVQSTGPAVTPAKGDKPSREFVIGKWGTNGNCDLAIELRADGTSDGPFGNWTYDDGVIGFTDEPDFKVKVFVVDDSTMESTSESSGKTQQMTRCS